MSTLDADALLAKLQGAEVARLSEILVDNVLRRPLGERLDADRLLQLVRDAAAGWDDAKLAAFVDGEWERLYRGYGKLGGTVEAHVPADAVAAVEAQLRHPAPLDPVLLMALVDQPAVRTMMHELLQTTLSNFMKRASSPVADNKLASAVANRARGFLKSGMTGAVLSAVGEGLGAEADRRIRDFVDETTTAALQQVVARMADPAQEAAYGALRAGILRSAVQQDVKRWVEQLHRLSPPQRALKVVLAARDAVTTEAFEKFFRAQHALLRPTQQSLEQVLAEAGVLEPVRRTLVSVVTDEVEAQLALDEVRTFVRELFGDAGAPVKKAARKKKG